MMHVCLENLLKYLKEERVRKTKREIRNWGTIFLMMVCCLFLSLAVGMDKTEAASLKAPEVSLRVSGTRGIRVMWEPIEGADGYIVYSKPGNTGQWGVLKELHTQATDHYSNIYLEPGTRYEYIVRAYQNVNGRRVEGTKSDVAIAITGLSTPGMSSVTALSYNQVKVQWKAVTNAMNYRVYRRTGSTIFREIARLSGNVTTYTDKTAQPGITYYYTVKATATWQGQTVLSSCHIKGLPVKTTLGASQIQSIQSTDSRHVQLTWQKVTGAQGYVIQRSTSDSGTYKKVKTIQNVSTVTWTDTVPSDGTYYYRIRAFKQQSTGFTYGAFSPVKSIQMKSLEVTDTFKNYSSYTASRSLIDSLAATIGGMSTYYNQNGYDYVRGGKGMIFAAARTANVSRGVYHISIYNTGYSNLVLHGAYLDEPIKSAIWKIKQSGYTYTGMTDAATYAFRSNDRHKAIFLKESNGVLKSWEYDIVSSQSQIGSLNSGITQQSSVSSLSLISGM